VDVRPEIVDQVLEWSVDSRVLVALPLEGVFGEPGGSGPADLGATPPRV